MIKVICEDGSGIRTKIVDAETGEDLGKLLGLKIGAQLILNEMVVLRGEMVMPRFEVAVGRADIMAKHPDGTLAPVRRIEFRDGTSIVFAEDGTPSFTSTSPGPKPSATQSAVEENVAALLEQSATPQDVLSVAADEIIDLLRRIERRIAAKA